LPEAFINAVFPDGSVEFNSTTDGTTGEVTKVASFIQTTAGTNDIPVYTETNNWEWGGSETTYFDATGKVLGYVNRNEWTDDYADPAAPGGATGGTSAGTVSYNISYQDANWNWIGNEWDDQWGSGSTFNVEVEVGDLASTHPIVVATATGGYLDGSAYTDESTDKIRVETGSSEWVSLDNTTETREWTYYFGVKSDGSMGDFLGGEETFDGTTTQYGLNWQSLGEKVDISDTSAFTVVTSTDLADLPDAFANATLSNSESKHGGTETTYFDSTGNIVGKAREYDDGVNSNTNYEDANGNWLGNTYNDEYGSGYSFTSSSNVNPFADSLDSVAFVAEWRGDNQVKAWPGDGVAEATNYLLNSSGSPDYFVSATNDSSNWSTDNGDLLLALKAAAPKFVSMQESNKAYDAIVHTVISDDGAKATKLFVHTDPANPGRINEYTISEFSVSSGVVAETGQLLAYLRDDSATAAVNGGSAPVPSSNGVASSYTEYPGQADIYNALLAATPVEVDATTVTHTDTVTGYVMTLTKNANGEVTLIEVEDKDGSLIASSDLTSDPLTLAGEGPFIIEEGKGFDELGNEGNSWKYVFKEGGNGREFLAGEETHHGVTRILGPNWQVVSEVVAGLDSLPILDPAVAADLTEINKLPDALKVYDSNGALAAIKISTKTYPEGTETTYIAPDGSILGYSNSYTMPADEYGSGGTGVSYSDENYDWLGYYDVNNDGSSSSLVIEDRLDSGGSVIGTKETMSESNEVGGVVIYSSTRIEEYDASDNFVGATETVTSVDASSGVSSTIVTKFDGNYNVIGSFDGAGNILDPLAVFQIGSFVFEADVVKGYAESNGVTQFYDGDSNGTSDVLEEDIDANGIADWNQYYAEDILHDAILSPDFKPEPILDGSSNVVGFQTATENYFVELFGSLTVVDGSPTAGNIDTIKVYKSDDTVTTGYQGKDGDYYAASSLIATADTLAIPIVDLIAYIDSANPSTGGGGNTTPATPDFTVFSELVDEDLNNSSAVDADGITWSTDGQAILERLLAPAGGVAPTPVPLTSPNGVSVTDGTYTLTILESSSIPGAIESITVYTGTTVIASATSVTETMGDIVAEFVQLDVVPSGSGGGVSIMHNYDVTVVDGDYALNGIKGLQIFPEAGHTYVFNLSDSTLDGHPFALSAVEDGTHEGGIKYETGVTMDATNKTLTLVAGSNTPSALYYYCETHSDMGNVVLAPLFGSNEVVYGDGINAAEYNNVDFNDVIAAYLHNSDEEGAVKESFNVKSVEFDIPLDATALAPASALTSAVDSVLNDWSTSGFLRLTVNGEELLTQNVVDTDSDGTLDGDAYFGGDELIDSFTLEAVVGTPGNETKEILFSKTFDPAVAMDDPSLDYDLTKGVAANIISGGDAVAQAKSYLDHVDSGVPGVLGGSGDLPDGVVNYPRSAAVEMYDLNTDTSDDTSVTDITPDNWNGQALNFRANLIDLDWIDDSAVATKIINPSNSNEWTGVAVTKQDFQMVMTFDAPIDATIENIESNSTVKVTTIEIYRDSGQSSTPNYSELVASKTNGTDKYFDFIDNFGTLDATSGSITGEHQVQGTLFDGLVDENSQDGLDLNGAIYGQILPDLLYPDQDIGDNTEVDSIEIYTIDGTTETLVAKLESTDEMLIGEVEAYVEQIFG